MEVLNSEYRIKAVLGRLDVIIENENQRIGTDPDFDFKLSNAHKSRCLYELTMLFRASDRNDITAAHLDQLHALKAKLKLNERRVEAHMRAVRAVAELLKNAVRSADDDGTYSQEQFLVRADR
ncbi:hypothetical protein [Aliirhizobium smilacinae]|uniref:Flagellar protein FlgN n=1 Tax=Aliirhizobium smilacinae TaxID=1395944 RepID=A0A5C4XRV5_9HYPH|nr:hypothetical protein [Rhizobium smilacinae]TNM66073.1 hypothetical protein FHP24_07605 [Rhizobium smilacinae]